MAFLNKQHEYFTGWVCHGEDTDEGTVIKLFRSKPEWNTVFGYMDPKKGFPYGNPDICLSIKEFNRLTGIQYHSLFPRPKNRQELEKIQKLLYKISITITSKVEEG